MSFDTLAPHYRWMEFVLAAEKLQRCRTAFLQGVRAARNILILGEGPGRFLLECRRRFPEADIICVDASAGMLARARRRLGRAGLEEDRTVFIRADALDWEAPPSWADLVVTHFFLDCFRPEQLERLIPRIAKAAQPSSAWLLADFQEPPFGLPRARARLILKVMYTFFGLATRLPARRLTCPDPLLAREGFELRRREVREWGLLRSDYWERSAPS